MVTLVKHEWHSVDSQFALELDESLLSDIYPDLDEDEIANLLEQIENGEVSVDEVIEVAYENDIDLEWERQYDDWWTDRKGGYDITYELGDESSWTEPEKPVEPTHKCTKCRWKGQSYETSMVFLNEDGSICEDDSLEHHSTKDVCPMCDGDVELTEAGVHKEEQRKKWQAEIDAMGDDF